MAPKLKVAWQFLKLLPAASCCRSNTGVGSLGQPPHVFACCSAGPASQYTFFQHDMQKDWFCCLLQDEFDVRRNYIKPAPTTATRGHALGAQKTIAKAGGSSPGSSPTGKAAAATGGWKMKKFESKAQPRVTQYITGQLSSKVEQIHQ